MKDSFSWLPPNWCEICSVSVRVRDRLKAGVLCQKCESWEHSPALVVHCSSDTCRVKRSGPEGDGALQIFLFLQLPYFLLKLNECPAASIAVKQTLSVCKQHSPWRAQRSASLTCVDWWPSTVSAGNICLNLRLLWPKVYGHLTFPPDTLCSCSLGSVSPNTAHLSAAHHHASWLQPHLWDDVEQWIPRSYSLTHLCTSGSGGKRRVVTVSNFHIFWCPQTFGHCSKRHTYSQAWTSSLTYCIFLCSAGMCCLCLCSCLMPSLKPPHTGSWRPSHTWDKVSHCWPH